MTVEALISGLGFLLASLTLYLQGQRERKARNQETYARLEFASIELFRYESLNIELYERLWCQSNPPGKDTKEFEALKCYICQILNLFEMAVRFRKENLMPSDIFGSWVIWMWDLCQAPGFPSTWCDVRWNYIPELRTILAKGMTLAKEEDNELARQKFFEMVGEYTKDKSLKLWFTITTP